MIYNKAGAILRTLVTADFLVENYQELLPHICIALPPHFRKIGKSPDAMWDNEEASEA